MKYIQLNEADEFVRYVADVLQYWDENNYCTPSALIKDEKAEGFLIAEAIEVAPPEYDPITQVLIEAPAILEEGVWTQAWEVQQLSPEEVAANIQARTPQEVSMGQCRLALFDKHGIETDEQFYALADILPEADRPRARLELRTRPTVRYDNPLVSGLAQAMGWDLDELFIYAATL